ncbi:hypothetical protein FVE85_8070 [Porphyridium purpureum]|uniref:Uncharacterized protein n=1 Tax=Porphyridium purpureum TaxID=35688 RepID=A0A5J4YPC9_PORPP|nr:hypothetical protein FVE85_8070 [Porphyridium purpureum]|eukprot:POR3587..scf295_9
MACWYGMQDLRARPGAMAQLSAAGGLSLGIHGARGRWRDRLRDAFKLVALRGKAMQDAADASVGGWPRADCGADENSERSRSRQSQTGGWR